MAISKNNPLTKGASGMIGGTMVFRSFNGKTYIYNRPSKPKTQSSIQKENRLRFKMATNFAKQMMKDPAKKEEYKQIAGKMKLPNAYTAAVTEYMRRSAVKEIDTSGYSGKEKEEIKITASKKGFEVEVVEVIIVDVKGHVVEQGKAVKTGTEEWSYLTSRSAVSMKALQITARARERTGNYTDRKTSKVFSE
jgi:hypothetical protein